MSDGRLLALDGPSRLRDAFPGEIIEVLAEPLDAAARAWLRRDPRSPACRPSASDCTCRVARGRAPEAAGRRGAALAGADVIDVSTIRQVPASLEDVFIDRVTHA